nr:MAG TPA: hypothetical protein [Caudoviricetes sp.]
MSANKNSETGLILPDRPVTLLPKTARALSKSL